LSYTPRLPTATMCADRVSGFRLGPASDHDPPTYASRIAGMTGKHHHAQFLLVDRVLLFAWDGLDL
jgi:hypothetical protein